MGCFCEFIGWIMFSSCHCRDLCNIMKYYCNKHICPVTIADMNRKCVPNITSHKKSIPRLAKSKQLLQWSIKRFFCGCISRSVLVWLVLTSWHWTKIVFLTLTKWVVISNVGRDILYSEMWTKMNDCMVYGILCFEASANHNHGVTLWQI